MAKQNTSFGFRVKENKTKNYLLEYIEHKELMRRKHRNVHRTLNYFFIPFGSL